jgi:GT2 family glycosyltransferase
VTGAQSPRRRLCDVVIATRNRPEPLRRCLMSLADQTAEDFGIIIVDDHSDPPLDEVVADLVASTKFEHDPVVVRLSEPSGPAAARNAGVAASSAEYVVFIDDDIVADRHLIELHLSEVIRESTPSSPVVTRGPFCEPPEWDPSPWNLWEARMAERGTNAIVAGHYVPTWRQFHTGNNCMSVDLFRAVGGFDETYKRAEDDEFGLRLHEHGCRFHFIPAALAYHYSNRSLEAWLVIPRAYAYYTVLIDRRYPHIGYLRERKAELAQSNALLRLARKVAGGERRTRAVAGLAVAVARTSHRLKLTAVTLPALSLAFDLHFIDSLRTSEAELGPHGLDGNRT